MNKKSSLANLLNRYRLAVIAHREASASIAYKISQSPNFGEISKQMLENYERTRIDLLDLEVEIRESSR